MNKTVYLRDEEAPIWERARELADDKLSPVIIAALRNFIAHKEAGSKGYERIEIRFNDSRDNEMPKAKAFYGRWIFSPSKPLAAPLDEHGHAFECFAVALTAKGSVVIYSWYSSDDDNEWNKTFSVYSSLEAAVSDSSVNWAARKTMEEIGVPVEELDI